jgi:glutaredoxin/glutathione-dependent peroxiredoxin
MIAVGDRLPEGKFRVKPDDGPIGEVPTAELFAGQTVVLVGVPGAFTSTCHNAHIPQFVENAAALKARGADRIVVLAVNDAHVMRAWRQSLGAVGKLDFVADGDGAYAEALGLLVPMAGMGMRLKRFSALVENGVVKALNFEPAAGKGISSTGAAMMLAQLKATAPAS